VDLLRHLRFFVTLADTRHFGHAADDLQMTQPPLSQGIQRLEKYLGVRLFDRSPRGVRLTTAGARLIPTAQQVLEAAESLRREAALPSEEVAPLRVGLPLGDPELTVRVMALANGASPVEVTPELRSSVDLVEGIAVGGLDIAVVRHPLLVDGAIAGDVVTLPTYLWEVEGTPADAPYVGPPREHHPPAHDQLLDALRRIGHPSAWIATPTFDEVLARVSAGTAVALTLDPHPPPPLRCRPLPPGLPPLRYRVLRHPLRQRPELDLAALARQIEAGLR
jgi:DNA-binding transcriptional LysR family regulator